MLLTNVWNLLCDLLKGPVEEWGMGGLFPKPSQSLVLSTCAADNC